MSVRRRLIVAGLVAVTALLGGACASQPADPELECRPSEPRSCLLPFPSDRYLVADGTTATGWRVAVPDDVLPASVLGQLRPGGDQHAAYDGADGFSPLTPITFQFPTALTDGEVADNGGGNVTVVDSTTGAPVDFRTDRSVDAVRFLQPDTVLMLWPATVWPYGHRVTATVSLPGRPVTSTSFVVRSQENGRGNLDALAAAVRAEDHPVRSLSVGPSLLGGAQLVSGEVATTDFRDDDWTVPREGAATRRTTWVRFIMTLPERPASAKGAPVAIYGHGITAFKETMAVVAGPNAEAGIATIAIDIPDHGERMAEGSVPDLAIPAKLGQLVSMPLQGALDELSLVLAVRSHLGPLRSLAPEAGVDLDVDHLYYQGTSMGGFLGAELLAIAPEIRAAFLQVPGSGIIDTLYHSVLWPVFCAVLPSGISAGESGVLLSAAASMADRADNALVLDRLKAMGTPVRIVYGAGDGTVPNTSTDRMLRLLDIPVAGPIKNPTTARRVDPDSLSKLDGSQLDRVATQIDTWGQQQSWAGGLLTHLSFLDQTPMEELSAWIERRADEARG